MVEARTTPKRDAGKIRATTLFGAMTPTPVRMAFPDYFVKYAPHPLQRLSERLFDFPIPASVRRNRLLFIHVPKNAGTTISTQLYGGHLGHRKALFYLRSDSSHFQSKLKFAIVRNPWSRLVSAYEFGKTINPNHRPYLRETRLIFQEYRTFSDFVNLFLWENRARLDSLDPIFRPQFAYLCDKEFNIIVDKIFHFENLQQVSEWAGSCGETIDLELKLNTSRYLIDDGYRSKFYRSYYNDPLLIERVGTIYRKDIELFGYEFESSYKSQS
jgi:Sulfotransferase family